MGRGTDEADAQRFATNLIHLSTLSRLDNTQLLSVFAGLAVRFATLAAAETGTNPKHLLAISLRNYLT